MPISSRQRAEHWYERVSFIGKKLVRNTFATNQTHDISIHQRKRWTHLFFVFRFVEFVWCKMRSDNIYCQHETVKVNHTEVMFNQNKYKWFLCTRYTRTHALTHTHTHVHMSKWSLHFYRIAWQNPTQTLFIVQPPKYLQQIDAAFAFIRYYIPCKLREHKWTLHWFGIWCYAIVHCVCTKGKWPTQ